MGEIVHVPCDDDTSVDVFRQDGFDKGGGDIELCSSTFDTAVDRWAGIAVRGGSETLRAQMDVDSEETGTRGGLPCGCERFPGLFPCLVGGLDATGVMTGVRYSIRCLGGHWRVLP